MRCSKTREAFISDPNLLIIVDNAPKFSCVGDKDCSLIQIAISKAAFFSFLFFFTSFYSGISNSTVSLFSDKVFLLSYRIVNCFL